MIGPFQSIVIGVILGVTGGFILWGGMPMHRMRDGRPSQWALRSRVGAGLYVLLGAGLTSYGIWRIVVCVGR
jgi:hypothetical protein